MSNQEACKLILENIEMFDEATKLLEEELSKNFFKAINETIRNKVMSFDGNWQGEYEFYDNTTIQFAPVSWTQLASDEFDHKKYFARYGLGGEYFENGSSQKGTHYWITGFFPNAMKERMVFTFYPWYSSYQKCSKKDWKSFAEEKHQAFSSEIQSLGFEFNRKEGSWYLPINSLDKKIIAENYVDDNLDEEAFKEILEALDKLEKAHKYFDQIVQEAIQRFGRAEAE